MSAIIDYRGKSPRKTSSGVPLITAKIIKGGRILDPQEFVANAEYDAWMRRGRVRRGDVVITTEAPLGEVAQLRDEHVALAQRVILLRGDPRVLDNTFLKFALQSPFVREQLFARQSGTTVLGIRQSELRRVMLPVPKLSEQQRIAAVLGGLDEKMELNRQTNSMLEAMAAAVFRSWFIDFDPVVAKAGEEHTIGVPDSVWAEMPESFDEDRHGRLPHGWTRRPLRDVVAINARHVSRDFPHATIEYLDISSVDRGRYDSSTLMGLVAAPSRARRLAKNGDVLWSCVRPNRRSYLLVAEPPDNLVVSTGFAVLSPRLIPSSFLYLSVTTDDFVDFLTANAAGSAYPAVRPETFARATIVVPPKGILDGFDHLVAPMLALVAANERENRTLSALRDTLVPQLLSGSIRLHDAEEAVAGAL